MNKKMLIIISLFLLVGCSCGVASQFSARTTASMTMPNGVILTWDNTKNIKGFTAKYDPKTGYFEVTVNESSTSDIAIEAANKQSDANSKIAEMLMQLGLKYAPLAAGS